MRFQIRIPNWHPSKVNDWDGKHWAVRSKLKKADARMIGGYVHNLTACEQELTRPRGKRRVSLRLSGWKRGRTADPDAFWKSTLDALVHAGVLKDDGPSYVELGSAEVRRSPFKETLIIVEDVAAAEGA